MRYHGSEVSMAFAFALALIPQITLSSPFTPPKSCTPYDSWLSETTTTGVQGTPFNSYVAVPWPGTLTFSENHAVGVTQGFSIGFQLEPNAISILSSKIKLTAAYTYSTTTTNGDVSGASIPCPQAPAGTDQWTCAAVITPTMVSTTGQVQKIGCTSLGDYTAGPIVDYTIGFPETNNGNFKYVVSGVCSCGNLNGWGSPGAPALCPQDC